VLVHEERYLSTTNLCLAPVHLPIEDRKVVGMIPGRVMKIEPIISPRLRDQTRLLYLDLGDIIHA